MADGYDVVVIGAGTGGYSAALRASQLGKRVAIVERRSTAAHAPTRLHTDDLPQSAAVLDTVTARPSKIKASGEPDRSAIKAFQPSSISW
jgi:dihydrolipoamide dehydrogenase